MMVLCAVLVIQPGAVLGGLWVLLRALIRAETVGPIAVHVPEHQDENHQLQKKTKGGQHSNLPLARIWGRKEEENGEEGQQRDQKSSQE